MKKLLAIALIASFAIGSALQAKRDDQGDKGVAIRKPMTMDDPKELNKQIKEIGAEIRKLTRKKDRYVADQRKAANKGDLARTHELSTKIKLNMVQLAQKQQLVHVYAVRLATLKAKEQKAEKPKKVKKVKTKKVKKDKGYKADKKS